MAINKSLTSSDLFAEIFFLISKINQAGGFYGRLLFATSVNDVGSRQRV